MLFDLAEAKYSISGEDNKRLIHFWSEERNLVRRVLDVESKGETLRVTVQKNRAAEAGAARNLPRARSAYRVRKKATRAGYQRILEQVLRKRFPDLALVKLSHAVDLENFSSARSTPVDYCGADSLDSRCWESTGRSCRLELMLR